jgi:hypothetical protein
LPSAITLRRQQQQQRKVSKEIAAQKTLEGKLINSATSAAMSAI